MKQKVFFTVSIIPKLLLKKYILTKIHFVTKFEKLMIVEESSFIIKKNRKKFLKTRKEQKFFFNI